MGIDVFAAIHEYPSWLAGWLPSSLLGLLAGWLALLAGWLASRLLAGHLAGWLTGCSPAWLAAGWLVGWLLASSLAG